jgi:hypothetical protein
VKNFDKNLKDIEFNVININNKNIFSNGEDELSMSISDIGNNSFGSTGRENVIKSYFNTTKSFLVKLDRAMKQNNEEGEYEKMEFS